MLVDTDDKVSLNSRSSVEAAVLILAVEVISDADIPEEGLGSEVSGLGSGVFGVEFVRSWFEASPISLTGGGRVLEGKRRFTDISETHADSTVSIGSIGGGCEDKGLDSKDLSTDNRSLDVSCKLALGEGAIVIVDYKQ